LSGADGEFGQEGVPAAAVGLPIERAIAKPADIDRAIETGGEGGGIVTGARPQQLGPGFGAVSAVFGQEGVFTAAIGLSIKRAIGIPADVD